MVKGNNILKKLQDFSGSNVSTEFNVKWLKESQGMNEMLFNQTGFSTYESKYLLRDMDMYYRRTLLVIY